MGKVVVTRNVCDVYADPSQSERVSQAIMGQVLAASNGARGDHVEVVTPDSYGGHVRAHTVAVYEHNDWKRHQVKRVKSLFAHVQREPRKGSELMTTLVLSTVVAVTRKIRRYTGVLLPDGTVGWVRSETLTAIGAPKVGPLSLRTVDGVTRGACRVAVTLVGTPYLWGGCTPYGIDCSGFTQLCYAVSGVQLLRDAWMQMDDSRFGAVAHGQPFENADLRQGDLVFFGVSDAASGKGKVTHVGMILADGRIIHSAGGYGVVIESRSKHRLASAYLGARRLIAKS